MTDTSLIHLNVIYHNKIDLTLFQSIGIEYL